MAYLGDIHLGDTIDFKFATVQSTGAPTTLSGSPVLSAYVDNGTTELTAGITLSVDFDSRTGLNNCRVVATGGNGYAAGTNIDIVVTTGTVNSVSVVGYVVGSFSIDKRGVNQILGTAVSAPATAGVLDVNVKNMNNVSASAITTIKAVQGLTTADTVVTVSGNVNGNVAGSVGSVTGAVGSVTGNVGGNVTGSVGSVVGAVGSVTGAVGSVTGNVGGNVVGTVASVVGNVGGNVTGSVGSVVGAVGSVTGAVGSVTGNVGGNVVGSVASVTAVVSANVTKLNGTTLNGDGSATPWGP